MKNRLFIAFIIGTVLIVTVLAAKQGRWSETWKVPAYRQKGPASAPVVITEFSDFQCPICARARTTLEELTKRHEGKIVVVFRHYPLKSHRWSRLAASAAESAGAQGRFWDYQNLLFDRQKEWSETQDPRELFSQYAAYLGLDLKRFQSDLESGRWDKTVQRDVEAAQALQVKATPTFFFNKRRVVGDSQLKAFGEQFVELESGS
ncbi:MAG: thioredoxin domain-containing protein [Elusimicrobia bacterium]|nr:thioredoxin domain-containing protein [Elusimicrobiota bacterium]